MNFIRTAFIILFVLATVLTAMIKPGVHNPILIENSDFELVSMIDDKQPIAVVEVPSETKKVQISQPVQNVKTQQIVYNAPQTVQDKRVVNVQNVQPAKKNVNVTTNTTPQDKSQLEMLQKIIKNVEQAEQKSIQKTEQPKPVQQQVFTQPQPKEVKVEEVAQLPKPKPVEKTVTTNTNPYMTAEEEIIAWNVWRSNIHNQIMRDSDIGIAMMGTVFSFSFVVDKFGNVSNIKVEAFPDYFMDIARDGVKPAIARLQNKPILEFPRGTKRTTTVVEGRFAVGTANRFSTPNEYSDYERVVR